MDIILASAYNQTVFQYICTLIMQLYYCYISLLSVGCYHCYIHTNTNDTPVTFHGHCTFSPLQSAHSAIWQHVPDCPNHRS
jgi:hypothetical protein